MPGIYFPEIMKAFSDPSITQSSFNLQTEQKPTTIGLIIYKHSTRTKSCQLCHGRSEEKLSKP